METVSWKLMSTVYQVISIIVCFDFTDGNSCLVTPSSVAVTAGNSVSLTCTAGSDQITRWSRGISNDNNASNVYEAPIGNLQEILVDGYLVDGSADNQINLTLNKASTVQADRYYCGCAFSSSNDASVTVLVSKPIFSSSSQIADGKPVTFTCSVSFNGTAAASIVVTDISGGYIAQNSTSGAYPSSSSDLQVISLDYNITANSNINQTYLCRVNLIDKSVIIYSEQVVTTLHWTPVQNVKIIPVDKDRCSNVGQCVINEAILCVTDGNPNPVLFHWTGSLNGTMFSVNTSGQLTLIQIGHYTIQCTAFNSIGGITNNNTSEYFKTEVTVGGPPTTMPDIPTQGSTKSKTALIVGLVVGLGGSIMIVTIIALTVIICKRKKKDQQNEEGVYTTVTLGTSQPDLYTELQVPHNDHVHRKGHRVVDENYDTVNF